MAFLPPRKILPEKVNLVAAALGASGGYQANNSLYPLRKGNDLYQLLLDDRTGEVSLAEWSVFLSNQSFWSALDKESLDDLVLIIYTEIEVNASLRGLLLLKALLTAEQASRYLPTVLFENIDLIKDCLTGDDVERFVIIHGLFTHNFKSTIERCVVKGISHVDLLKQLKWAGFKAVDDAIFTWLLENTQSTIESEAAKGFLCLCFASFSLEQQVKLIDKLFDVGFSFDDDEKSWLRKSASPVASGQVLWLRLNDQTQLKIIQLLKFNAFYLLMPVAKQLRSALENTAEHEAIKEAKRLKSRFNFWTNYTESMIAVKWVHHPYHLNIMGAAKTQGMHLALLKKGEIELLEEYLSPFLLMEFQEYVVLDQLCNGFGAVRIFKKNAILMDQLLGGSIYTTPCNITLRQLLSVIQLDFHDHALMWQQSLEKRLRCEYKILPNQGIENFKGLPPSVEYSPVHGLPVPSHDETKKRREDLDVWNSKFYHLEVKLEKYKSNESVDKLEAMIKEPYMKMQLRDKTTRAEAVRSLKGLVEDKTFWATKLLGEFLLTEPNLSKEDRELGEKYIKRVDNWKSFLATRKHLARRSALRV